MPSVKVRSKSDWPQCAKCAGKISFLAGRAFAADQAINDGKGGHQDRHQQDIDEGQNGAKPVNVSPQLALHIAQHGTRAGDDATRVFQRKCRHRDFDQLAIARHAQGIIVSPAHQLVLTSVLQKAVQARIPVVIVGSPVALSTKDFAANR